MTEITITSTFMKDPGNAEKPTVQIGRSEFSYEKAKKVILGPYLTSQAEIDPPFISDGRWFLIRPEKQDFSP